MTADPLTAATCANGDHARCARCACFCHNREVEALVAKAVRAALRDPCSEPGCDGKVRARGLCDPHYQRARRQGTREMHDLVNPDRDRWVCDCPHPTVVSPLGECSVCRRADLPALLARLDRTAT